MRLELTRVGLLVELANHYTTKGALIESVVIQSNTWNNLTLLAHAKLNC